MCEKLSGIGQHSPGRKKTRVTVSTCLRATHTFKPILLVPLFRLLSHAYYLLLIDTAFMYVIVALGILRIYQLRHPSTINANAHEWFFFIVLTILISTLGVVSYNLAIACNISYLQYFNNWIFWIAFALYYSAVIVYVSIEFYYKGLWSWYKWDDFRNLSLRSFDSTTIIGAIKPIHTV